MTLIILVMASVMNRINHFSIRLKTQKDSMRRFIPERPN